MALAGFVSAEGLVDSKPTRTNETGFSSHPESNTGAGDWDSRPQQNEHQNDDGWGSSATNQGDSDWDTGYASQPTDWDTGVASSHANGWSQDEVQAGGAVLD
jgi:hypothetical protein